ncbi:Tn3 family transposase [Streptosporangium minutum]|uniref:Tn3 family transposase n=1 Tax=Streptosporangium minutum TaxID=569862 RepID=UPI001A982936
MPGGAAGDYGPLEAVARQKAALKKIITRWPDMLRVVGSLITNQVRAYDLLRMFSRGGRPNPLGHAHLNVLGRYAFTASQPPAKIVQAGFMTRGLVMLIGFAGVGGGTVGAVGAGLVGRRRRRRRRC